MLFLLNKPIVSAYSAAEPGFLPAARTFPPAAAGRPAPPGGRGIPGRRLRSEDSKPAGRWENGAIEDLLEKRLLFVTGKGGVGKTTVSYALGLAAAARGRRAIVCEIAAQERGAALYGRPPLGFREQELEEGLWGISIDPELMIREYLEVQMPVRAMATAMARSSAFNYLAAATPGLQEMVTMGKVWELSLRRRKAPGHAGNYDVVIVDAPATGHGIGFLRTPARFRDLTRAGPLARQAAHVERTLADPDETAVVVVSTPEEMAVNETVLLDRELALDPPFRLVRLYANAVHPERFTAAERGRIEAALADAQPAAAAALEGALRASDRAAAQRAQLDRLRAAVSAPIVELPFLYAPRLGLPELRRLAERLR